MNGNDGHAQQHDGTGGAREHERVRRTRTARRRARFFQRRDIARPQTRRCRPPRRRRRARHRIRRRAPRRGCPTSRTEPIALTDALRLPSGARTRTRARGTRTGSARARTRSNAAGFATPSPSSDADRDEPDERSPSRRARSTSVAIVIAFHFCCGDSGVDPRRRRATDSPAHPFTEPAVRPRTKYRCSAKNTTSGSAIEMNAAAVSRCQFSPARPTRSAERDRSATRCLVVPPRNT